MAVIFKKGDLVKRKREYCTGCFSNKDKQVYKVVLYNVNNDRVIITPDPLSNGVWASWEDGSSNFNGYKFELVNRKNKPSWF